MFNYSIQVKWVCDQTLAFHYNSSQLSTLVLILTGINIASSITATLGNALILVALNKVSSLNPPSKLFLRCLAFSDLSVGLLVQPAAAVSLSTSLHHRWNICRVSQELWFFFTVFMTAFSFSTVIAIGVDRLLALLLGIRYRKVVTIKRARFLVVPFLLASTANYVIYYVNIFAFILFSAILWSSWLIVSIYCYARIYLTLQNHIQAQITSQDDQSNGISPINLLRYKKTVSTALWIFAAMMICYVPFGLVIGVVATTSLSDSFIIINFFGLTLVFFNSSLNPVLYCWKIREVRNAVKKILRNLVL